MLMPRAYESLPIDKYFLHHLLISGQIHTFNQQKTQLGKYPDLSSLDLSNRILSGSDFSNSDLSNVDFSNSDLSNVDFSNSDLSNVDFSNSNLINSNMKSVNLTNAKLIETNLQNVDLRLAILDGVILKNAILKNSNIVGTHLDSKSFEKDESIIKIDDGGFVIDTSKMTESKYNFVYDSQLFSITSDENFSGPILETIEEVENDF